MSAQVHGAGCLLVHAAGIPPSRGMSIFKAVDANPARLSLTVDGSPDAIGRQNGNPPGTDDPAGRQQTDADTATEAVSDFNRVPGEFFNFGAPPRARGIEVVETGATSGYRLSSTAASGEPPRCGFPLDFVPLSEERLFTPIDGNTCDILLFDLAD